MWSHQWWVMSHESSHSALWVLPYRNMHIRMRANWILVFWICTMISEKNIWGFLFIQFYFLSNIWSFPLFFLSLNFFQSHFWTRLWQKIFGRYLHLEGLVREKRKNLLFQNYGQFGWHTKFQHFLSSLYKVANIFLQILVIFDQMFWGDKIMIVLYRVKRV